MKKARRKRKKSKKTLKGCSFTDDKIEAMKQRARELSKIIVQNTKSTTNQQLAPSESCNNGEHCPKIENASQIIDTENSHDNDQLSVLMNNKSKDIIPHCSRISIGKELSDENTTTPNNLSKKRNSKDPHTKFKKSKIPYLVKSDVYQEEHVDHLTSKKQDDYVLEKLFNKSGKL